MRLNILIYSTFPFKDANNALLSNIENITRATTVEKYLASRG